jgi:methylase of polypeptide subunit release factors
VIVAGTELRGLLERAGFDEEGIAAALGLDAPVGSGAAAAYLRRLPPESSLATAVRLFVVGEPAGRAEVERLLPVEELVGYGVAGLDGAGVVPRFALRLWRGTLLAHDFDRAPLQADHVVGIGPATRTVAALTVRRPVKRALDIGTGCGAQALLAARHAEAVVATDVNERALELARLNARLNGLDNIELRAGSLFDPVAGERFDLIVSNPPFVISPDSELVFRDGGHARDELSRAVVHGLAEHLADGGVATTLASWAHGKDEDWSRPVRDWIAGSGCDAIVVRYVCDDDVGYAVKWAADDSVDRWLDYYRDSGIGQISTGAVVLRRRDGRRSHWVEAVDAFTGPSPSAGAQLERMFAGRDLLESSPDLLREHLALVPHRLQESLVWTGDAYAPQHLALTLDDGVGIEGPLQAPALRTLFGLDGSRPLEELPDARDALPTIERLLELGFVECRS